MISLNVEGPSMEKCEYLGRILTKYDVDILQIQESHLTESASPSRYVVPGYTLIARLDHEQYGIATYASSPNTLELVNSSVTGGYIFNITVKLGDLSIAKIYKPPLFGWPDPPFPCHCRPSVVAGDFNSHHTEWGIVRIMVRGRKCANGQSETTYTFSTIHGKEVLSSRPAGGENTTVTLPL